MNQVEVLDNGIVLNGNLLTFPLSYEDIRALFGMFKVIIIVNISMMSWEYHLRVQLHIFGT